MSHLDSERLTIACPECGSKITKAVRVWKRQGNRCRCGTVFDTFAFRRDIAECDREIDRFKRELGKIKIDIRL